MRIDETKRLRRSLGMNQGEFAKYLGISRAALSAWENGRAEPSSANIRKILKIFKDNNQTKKALEIYNDQITYFSNEKILFLLFFLD